MNTMNDQMKEISDQYEKLNPLPLQDVSSQIARQLPELKDAVMAVINDHPTKRILWVMEDIAVEERILIPGPGGDMLARVYNPPQFVFSLSKWICNSPFIIYSFIPSSIQI